MKTIRKIEEIRSYLRNKKYLKKTIALVPTMGALHNGHLSLVSAARKKADIVVVSIFVNPIQFGPGEDYKKYPREIKQDQRLLAKSGADILFYPSANEMFEAEQLVYVEVSKLDRKLCGKYRPGHFRGVATVVSKLFNIIDPDVAFFGEKDYQQLLVVRQMAKDLNCRAIIIGMPTVREKDGLAMSSRNKYLDVAGRRQAPVLYKALKQAEMLAKKGVRSKKTIKQAVRNVIKHAKGVKIEYVEILNANNLEDIEKVKGRVLLALAARISNTRLIDNIVIKV
jgi:pantoate--beta-alanine ligase